MEHPAKCEENTYYIGYKKMLTQAHTYPFVLVYFTGYKPISNILDIRVRRIIIII